MRSTSEPSPVIGQANVPAHEVTPITPATSASDLHSRHRATT